MASKNSNGQKKQIRGRKEMFGRSEGQVEKFVQQNSPVNNELIRNPILNDLLDDKAIDVIVRRKRGKIEPIASACSFYYVDDANLTILNKNGRFRITAYDRRVYNAIGTLWLNGRRTMSLSEIFCTMCGYTKTNPSTTQLQSLSMSLKKLQSIWCSIDITKEVKANLIRDKALLAKAIETGFLRNKKDSVSSATISGNMLTYTLATLETEQGQVFRSIQVEIEPFLLTYNLLKRTLIEIPVEYIGLPELNATEKAFAFQDYLLMRVINYQRGKMRENKILYETLYRDSGIDQPEDNREIFRDRGIVRRLFDEWQKKGLITSYEEVRKGRAYVGIVFQVQSKQAAEEAKETENEE